ncbi:MAG: DUF1501 domain-containing protein, partial [Planctomycetaceae bacterium]
MIPSGFPLTRRQQLKSAAVGFGGLAFAALSHQQAAAETGMPLQHHAVQAKRVIFMFMKGGPSQVDTFDYKPQLQKDHGKPLPFEKPRIQFAPTNNLLGSPWRFRPRGESGIPVSDLFPHVGACADDLCVIRSMVSNFSEH